MAFLEQGSQESLSVGDGLILPGYFRRDSEGIYVDLTQLPSTLEIERIIDRIFGAGFFLRGLDYRNFQSLLYGTGDFGGLIAILLAREIVVFPEERLSLYRSLKIDDVQAEYLFEPVQIERRIEVPLFEIGPDGEPVQIGTEEQVESEPTQLDFDEFIAFCWNKGLRFGIDAAKVRQSISLTRPERVVIARSQPATEGRDAGVEEQTKAMHRSNSPRLLPDGRVDLSQYANRFPQIQKGTLLLMKTPRELGQPGRQLDGTVLEPRLPDDFELSSLAGENTHVERENDGEYLVASISGFLNIDTQTNQISITEKIVNRDGVNARTTGNLVLEGDEYEEYGEVQEGRMVEGKSLSFHANVFGRVTSTGGRILIEQNLAGGMALNRDGDIEVRGIASSAILRCARGTIQVQRAENSVLVADRVEIDTAFQCTVLAEEIVIKVAASCSLGGKKVQIGEIRSRGSEETLISMLMPDLRGFEHLQAEEQKYLAECDKMIEQLRHGLSAMTSQPELQHYLAIAGKLHRKEIKLSPAQQANWQQLGTRMAPALKRIKQAREDVSALETEINSIKERIADLDKQKSEASSGIECQLGKVTGDTRVRPLIVLLEAPPLTRMSPRDLRLHLRNPVQGEKMLFSGSSDSFSWVHQTPF